MLRRSRTRMLVGRGSGLRLNNVLADGPPGSLPSGDWITATPISDRRRNHDSDFIKADIFVPFNRNTIERLIGSTSKNREHKLH